MAYTQNSVNNGLFISASSNTFLGYQTGNTTLTPANARYNTAVGVGALNSLVGTASTNGQQNTAVGYNSLTAVTEGKDNNAFGALSLGAVSIGNRNCAFGSASLAAATGSDNAGFGASAMSLWTSGADNVAFGNAAGKGAGATTGSFNTFLGSTTGSAYNDAESSNILVGYGIAGTAAESNVLRIGTATGTGNGELAAAYIAGIYAKTIGGTAGVVLCDSTNKVASVAGAGGTVLIGGAYPTWLANGTAGQVLTSQGTTVDPHWTSVAVAGWSWVATPATTYTIAVAAGTAYVVNPTAQACIATLPASPIFGDTYKFVNINATYGWKIAQRASQTILFGNQATTAGTGGYLETTAIGDSVEMVYAATNTFVVTSAVGNITFN